MKQFSRLNVQPENCTFYVNQEKKTIVCVYECAPYVLLHILPDYDLWSPPDKHMVKMRGKYVGIARCSPEDTWEEQTGRDLAFARMKQKYMRNIFSVAQDWVNKESKKLDDTMDCINRFGKIGGDDLMRYKDKLHGLMK